MSAPTRQITRLDNGLTVLTDRMASVESVSLGVWIGVGTRHETAAHGGVAHLLEHMTFKGTRRRDAFAIAEEIEDVGGHLNAYTAREQTAYYAKVLSEDAPLAIDLLADILQNSLFDETELTRERAVVLQEIGQAADTPDDIIFDDFQETAFPDQPVGRPVLGRAETVARMSRAAVTDFVRQNYAGDRMVVAAAGKLEHDAIVAQVAAAFADLPAVSQAKTAPARYRGGEHRTDKELEQVHLVLGFDGVSFDDPDFYALQGVLNPVRRRHVLAAVPRSARKTRPRLFHLLFHLVLQRRRYFWHLRRHRPGPNWRINPGFNRPDGRRRRGR